MKHLARLLTVFSLLIGFCGWFATPQTAQAVNLQQSLVLPSVSLLAVEGVEEEAPRRNEEGPRRNEADDSLSVVYGEKIDLNNSNIRYFQQYRGFYPNLASAIIKNAPYKKVEDVLNIPGLSPSQMKRLQDNLENFTISKEKSLYNEGDDRINPGIYR